MTYGDEKETSIKEGRDGKTGTAIGRSSIHIKQECGGAEAMRDSE